ncbi:MAG: hypothetical protein IJR07_08745 [Bacteroidaceae bacterium]|nr:hypothetical protein [Bacteroidaceae bacterium]
MRVKVFVQILSFLILIPAMGQERNTFEHYRQQRRKLFNNVKEQKRAEFDEYRRKKNAEFATYLGKSWEPLEVQEGIEPEKQPDPVGPTIAPKLQPTALPEKPVELPKAVIIPATVPPPSPTPIAIPLPDEGFESKYLHEVDLFNTPVVVNINPTLQFKMNGCDEKETMRIWNLLNTEDYDELFFSCEQQRKDLNLNGWALVNLCRVVSEELLGQGTNEAVVMQTFLLTQFGYNARLARVNGNHLVMICPADINLAKITYLILDNVKYYIWSDINTDVSFYSYKQNCPDANRSISMSNANAIQLSNKTLPTVTYKSKWDNELVVSINVKKSLMAYYAGMPQALDFSFYANQPMDNDMNNQLLTALRNYIIGKSELEAANVLLHFVQTAFEYKTDDDQFGYERSFYKEELFYYPFSDCEDRAILFSHLMKQLLGTDVFLLEYPNHACTAVKFKEEFSGDYVVINGDKYIICDPCYINANVGMCMEVYKDVTPKVYHVRL